MVKVFLTLIDIFGNSQLAPDIIDEKLESLDLQNTSPLP